MNVIYQAHVSGEKQKKSSQPKQLYGNIMGPHCHTNDTYLNMENFNDGQIPTSSSYSTHGGVNDPANANPAPQ